MSRITSQTPAICKDVLDFGFGKLDGLSAQGSQKLPLDKQEIGRVLRGAVNMLSDDIKLCFVNFLKRKYTDRRYVAMCLLITFDPITNALKKVSDLPNAGLTTRDISTVFKNEDKSDLYTAGALYDFFKNDDEKKINKRYLNKEKTRALVANFSSDTGTWKVVEKTRDQIIAGKMNSVIIIARKDLVEFLGITEKIDNLIKLYGGKVHYILHNGVDGAVDVLCVRGDETTHSRYVFDSGRLIESFWDEKPLTHI